MSESMMRYFYCDACGETFTAQYEDWTRRFLLFCARCAGRPQRAVVYLSQLATMPDEQKRQFDRLLTRSGVALPAARVEDADEDDDDDEEADDTDGVTNTPIVQYTPSGQRCPPGTAPVKLRVQTTNNAQDLARAMADAIRVLRQGAGLPRRSMLANSQSMRLAERREVWDSFAAWPVGLVVYHLWRDYLADLGVWYVSEVPGGDAEVSATFNHVSLASAFDQLAETAGCVWGIDAAKQLFFLPEPSAPSAARTARDDGSRDDA